MVVAFYQGSSNKKQGSSEKEEDAEAKEETFEQSFVNELVKYGGIKRAVAIKTLEKQSIEDKTMHLTTILQKIKDGALEIDDQENENDNENTVSNVGNCRREETAVMQNFLKRSYIESMCKEYAEEEDTRRQVKAEERKLELASEYEKVMLRLNNMYCR